MGVHFTGFLQHLGHFFLVKMSESLDIFGCRNGSLLQAIVWDVIRSSMVVGREWVRWLHRSHHPASGEDEHVNVRILLKLSLKLLIAISIKENVLVAPKARGCVLEEIPYFWRAATALYFQLRNLGKSQIISWGVVDSIVNVHVAVFGATTSVEGPVSMTTLL